MTRSQLVIQRDDSLLITPGYGRERIAADVRRCAELRNIVAGSFVYRLSPIAIWGSAARGLSAAELLAGLDRHSTTPIPASLEARVSELVGRYGKIQMVLDGDLARFTSGDPDLLLSLDLGLTAGPDGLTAPAGHVGRIKLAAARAGWPVVEAVRPARRSLAVRLRPDVRLRRYQAEAAEAFRRAGNGVVLLPCGAGKTLVGIAAICNSRASTLILGPSRSVVEQWRSALVAATDVDPSLVSIAGPRRETTPITIATYHSASMGEVAGRLLDKRWGLVIYDEVQSLPADVFRLSAALQADMRLGLSATLVREDGRQNEVFALVGPPVYDVPWIELESEGWIAPARCVEVRVPEAPDSRRAVIYKLSVVERLLARHREQPTLLMGSSLAGLEAAGSRFSIPVLTGKSSRARRSALLDAFRDGRITQLALSRIGSVGIDLPDAEVLIQLSGTFGSRQEEAQRLGRVLRPGDGKVASFYSLVSEGTSEPRHAEKRQRFLVEQGYRYEIINASDLPRPGARDSIRLKN